MQYTRVPKAKDTGYGRRKFSKDYFLNIFILQKHQKNKILIRSCHDPLPVDAQLAMKKSTVTQEVLGTGMKNTSKLTISQQKFYLQYS